MRRIRSSQGFSQLEVVIATLISSVLLISSLQSVGASFAGKRMNGDDGRGHLFAQELLEEILELPYVASGPPTPPVMNRAVFDEINDYAGYSEVGLRKKDGTAIPNGEDWSRSVAVVFVTANNLTMTSGTDTGVRRVTVTAQRNGAGRQFSISSFVSNAWKKDLYQ